MRAISIRRKTSFLQILEKLKHGLKPASDTAAVEPSDTTTGTGAAKTIVVGKGDTLWDIAARVYGNGEMYERIFKANRDGISDPNRIFPGMSLNLPAVEAN